MKANRLLAELMLLQARGRVSTREVAERMEISARTAHRDMEALCAAGIPLVAWRGAQGGWELDRGWRTKVPALDEEELRAMLMTPAPSPGRAVVAAAERALDKLISAMPAALQVQASSLRARVYVDAAGWGPWTEDLSALPSVQEAVAGDLRLRFAYRTRDGRQGVRTVDALGLVCKSASWYLVARGGSGLRTFRVSRMAEVAVLTERFERPRRFDLARYWTESTARLAAEPAGVRVLLALPEEAAAELGRWRRLEPVSSTLRLPPGWGWYRVVFDDERQALFVTLGLGTRAVVRTPRELRDRVWREARAMVAHSRG